MGSFFPQALVYTRLSGFFHGASKVTSLLLKRRRDATNKGLFGGSSFVNISFFHVLLWALPASRSPASGHKRSSLSGAGAEYGSEKIRVDTLRSSFDSGKKVRTNSVNVAVWMQ